MESSVQGRSGDVASDLFVILVTVGQLIFFTFYHKYIAWYTRAVDGSISRISVLTDDYFAWLPFPIAASIIVIVASAVMIVWDNYWFRQIGWIVFCLCGIAVTVSLLTIFPFDFSVIPNANAAKVVPMVVTGFFAFMAVFYGTTALVMFVQLIRYAPRIPAS
ncbi:MAG TPA: hypothetical protein VLY63_03910 [Anaerolineae bacterium]|nr:hypothetical protein [Anaerolineae bacterium]